MPFSGVVISIVLLSQCHLKRDRKSTEAHILGIKHHIATNTSSVPASAVKEVVSSVATSLLDFVKRK